MIKAYAKSDVGKIREKNEELAKDALRVLGTIVYVSRWYGRI